MYVDRLSLTNFRNYARLDTRIPARITVLRGDNAQGKTNLLEAIYYLATTRSPLASSDRELINWTAEKEVIPFARVEAVFGRAGKEHTLDVTLVKERQADQDPEQASLRRKLVLDGVSRRAMDIVGQLNVVLFLPQDIVLASGSPGERRRYLDVTLCQVDPVYCRSLSRYNRVMMQRNALLRRVRDGQARVSELDYWDEQLAKLGAYLLCQRLWATRRLREEVRDVHRELTGGQEDLDLVYQASIAKHVHLDATPATLGKGEGEPSEATAEISALEGAFRLALRAVRSEEAVRCVTIVGPHRDDLRFLVAGIDMIVYGSRGQQRTIAIALKLAEVALMRQRTGESPVLLLDDVLSELDQSRSQFLLDEISRAQQVLITTTSLDHFPQEFLDSAVIWHVAAGSVSLLS